jgi:delta8-fatty-acid desaturase
MHAYQIGVIEGRWSNFLPPIQGGQFRSKDVVDTEDQVSDNETDSSSQGSSGEPSPLFEPVGAQLRQRKPAMSRSSSATSMSSLDVDNEKSHNIHDTESDWTKDQIKSDLDRYPELDPKTQDDIMQKYRLLDQRMRSEGLYDCDYKSYAIEMARYSFLPCSLVFSGTSWSSAPTMPVIWVSLTIFTSTVSSACLSPIISEV